MARIETQPVDWLDSYNGQFIVVAAPNYGCCQCGNRLKPHFGGLCTWIFPFPYPFIFEVCESCQDAGFKDLTDGGNKVTLISPATIRTLLVNYERIVGFVEATRLGDFVLMKPYPIKGV